LAGNRHLWLLLLLCACAQEEQAAAPATSSPTAPAAESVGLAPAEYVGSEACKGCHAEQFASWQTSHHWYAMQPAEVGSVAEVDEAFVAHERTTRFERTDGAVSMTTDDVPGSNATFSVPYSFGVAPLQQFLIEAGDGKLQASIVAWDSRAEQEGGQRWFHLREDELIRPDDVLHWTQPSSNWNFMCADCHSTGVRKGYDVESRSYQTTWEELTVGCEACHGPASAHISAPADQLPLGLGDQAGQVNACAPCHSRRSQLAEEFQPSADFLDHYLPSLLEPELYHADGQILGEVYVYGSFLQSKMHQQGVRCSDCHEPHAGKLRLIGNGVCTQCHNPAGRQQFPTLSKADYDDPAHHMHEDGTAGAQCVSCHMRSETYMVVDPRRDHSFRIPRPDLTVSIGVPNACNDCHTSQSADWAAEILASKFGPPDPHYGTVLAAARSADLSAESSLAELAGDLGRPGIVRGTALMLAGGYSRRMTSVAIEKGLRDSDPLVRIGAIRGAVRWAPDRQWAQLQRLLDDEHLAVRTEAARTLMPQLGNLPAQDRRRLGSALDEYHEVLSLNLDRAEGQTNLALFHVAKNDIVAAEAALEEALALNPQWVPALVNLADLYRATGRDSQGGDLLVRAVELVPDSPEALLARALWLVRQNRTDEALPLLKAAWEVSRGARYAYVYGVALNDTGDRTAAVDLLEQAYTETGDPQLRDTARSLQQ
jgi:tetratricopeptide (TPR) repeat protein